MRHVFASLRFRLALLAVLIAGVIQAVVGWVAIEREESTLTGMIDERLSMRADAVRDTMSRPIDREPDLQSVSDLVGWVTGSPFWRGFFLQLNTEDGAFLASSASLGGAPLPRAPALDDVAPGEDRFITLDGEAARPLLGERLPLRMLGGVVTLPDGRRARLLLATDMRDVADALSQTRVMMLASILSGMLAACIAALLVLRWAFAPLASVSRLAHRLTPESLDERIDVGARQGEIAEMATAMNEMLERLGEAFHAQGRFIADISHELKTPVAVLLTEAQVLRRSNPTGAECERFIASVEEEMFRLGKLVESFLTIARTGSGQLHTRQTLVPVVDMAMEAVSHCNALARQAGVRLAPSVFLPEDESIEPVALGDPDLVRTMIENLIRNAVKFAPPDTAIDVSVQIGADAAVVRVRDRGPGVPPEHIDRLFDRFTQAHDGGGRRRGAGLGLAIAKGVAELHKGAIGVRNLADGGCEFFVRLPLAGEAIDREN